MYTDELTRYRWVYFMPAKSCTLATTKQFVADVSGLLGKVQVQTLTEANATLRAEVERYANGEDIRLMGIENVRLQEQINHLK
eukprot:39338-Eustigmatos_ZCMA.PRE.1